MSAAAPARPVNEWRHRAVVITLVCAAIAATFYLAWQGAGYYRLPLTERPFHPQHAALRPAGSTGIRLGMLSAAIFAGIYLYPLRKRIKPMQRIGKTRHWLDIHVLLGLTVPVIVTFHSSLKLNGLVGMAYWIMIAIVVSGIAGRYLYAQIPRSVTAAELSLRELQAQTAVLSAQLQTQRLFSEAELGALLELPSVAGAESLPLTSVLFAMIGQDLRRPLRIAAARRKVLGAAERWTTLGGLRRSRHRELESVLDAARAQSWLTSKVLFLNRAARIFHLWHVVHRPFSYSFAILVTAHIATVILLGYF